MAVNGIKPSSQSITETANVSNQNLQTAANSVEKVSTGDTVVGADKNSQTTNPAFDIFDATEEQLDKKLKDALSMVNNKMKYTQSQTRLEFNYLDDINRVSMKIVDKDTGDVVKEVPPEKTLKMLEKLWEFAGLLIDEKL